MYSQGASPHSDTCAEDMSPHSEGSLMCPWWLPGTCDGTARLVSSGRRQAMRRCGGWGTHAAEAAAVAVGVLQLVRHDGQAVEKVPVLVPEELRAAAAVVAGVAEPAAVEAGAIVHLGEVRVVGALAAVVHVDVVDAERRDVRLLAHVVADELLHDGRDRRHVEQVAVASPPVQRIAAHRAGAAVLGRVGLLDLREDLVELVHLRRDMRRVREVSSMIVMTTEREPVREVGQAARTCDSESAPGIVKTPRVSKR